MDKAHNLQQRRIRATHLILHQVPVTWLTMPPAPDIHIQRVALPDQLVEVADLQWGNPVSQCGLVSRQGH